MTNDFHIIQLDLNNLNHLCWWPWHCWFTSPPRTLSHRALTSCLNDLSIDTINKERHSHKLTLAIYIHSHNRLDVYLPTRQRLWHWTMDGQWTSPLMAFALINYTSNLMTLVLITTYISWPWPCISTFMTLTLITYFRVDNFDNTHLLPHPWPRYWTFTYIYIYLDIGHVIHTNGIGIDDLIKYLDIYMYLLIPLQWPWHWYLFPHYISWHYHQTLYQWS